MRKILSLFAFLAVSFASFAQQITVHEFAEKLQKAGNNAQIIDVRTKDEFAVNHLPNAVNVDLKDKESVSKLLAKLDKNKPTFTYSIQSGRGIVFAKQLKELGFTQVYGLPGGIVNYVGSGYKIETFKTDKKFIVDSKNFHALINSDKVVLVDFSSRHCGGCVKFAPILNEIEKAYLGKASVVRVELDDNVELVKEQQIHSMPTIAIYKNGEIKWKKEGRLDRKEIETALNDNI